MEERKAFMLAYERGEVSFSALCRQFNISRPTGYKWLERFQQQGEAGLHDQSRAPLHPARGTPRFIQDRILELRQAHPSWGPKKLLAWLCRKEPRIAWPAASTVGELLRREGLAHPPAGAPAHCSLVRTTGSRAAAKRCLVRRLQRMVFMSKRRTL